MSKKRYEVIIKFSDDSPRVIRKLYALSKDVAVENAMLHTVVGRQLATGMYEATVQCTPVYGINPKVYEKTLILHIAPSERHSGGWLMMVIDEKRGERRFPFGKSYVFEFQVVHHD